MVFWGAWCRRGAPWATLTDKQPTVKVKKKKLGGFYHWLGWALEQSLNNQGTITWTIIEQSNPQTSTNKWTITDHTLTKSLQGKMSAEPMDTEEASDFVRIPRGTIKPQHNETVRGFFESPLYLAIPLFFQPPPSPSTLTHRTTHTGPNRSIIVVYDVKEGLIIGESGSLSGDASLYGVSLFLGVRNLWGMLKE